MAWQMQALALPGQYLLLEAVSGWSLLDLVDNAEISARIAEVATDWQPVSVIIHRGLFGVGDRLVIIGQALNPVPVDQVAAEAANAVNSFWTVALVRFTVRVSPTPDPLPSQEGMDWGSAIRWIATAAIVIGAAIIFVNVRKAFA